MKVFQHISSPLFFLQLPRFRYTSIKPIEKLLRQHFIDFLMLPKFNCRKSDFAMDEYLRIFKGPLKEVFAKNLSGVRPTRL